jgi:hypothetical protein
MVDADGPLKLLPTSILDIYKVFEYINMLSIGIPYQPYTVIPTLLGSDFGALGHLWSEIDVIMSWLLFRLGGCKHFVLLTYIHKIILRFT